MADDRQYDCSCPSTCGWRKKGPQDQALGRSRGGNSTKIYVLTDALGNPARFILTGGEKADSEALPLLRGQHAGAVLAEKGYDADYIVDAIRAMGSEVVIPPKSNRIITRKYDAHLYKGRNLIERMYGKLNQFRRVATRYDKLASSFMSFVLIAAIAIWLK